jgi:hypothetical protein
MWLEYGTEEIMSSVGAVHVLLWMTSDHVMTASFRDAEVVVLVAFLRPPQLAIVAHLCTWVVSGPLKREFDLVSFVASTSDMALYCREQTISRQPT